MEEKKVLPDELEVMGKCLELIQEFPAEDRKRILSWLAGKLGVSFESQAPGTAWGTVARGSPMQAGVGAGISPKVFLARKKPLTNAERVTCLAYFLTYSRGLSQFKTSDISKLNTEAAQVAFTNATVAVNDATKVYHYLAAAGGGKKQITSRGEAVVDALPDRDRVKVALSDHPVSRRARKLKVHPKGASKKTDVSKPKTSE